MVFAYSFGLLSCIFWSVAGEWSYFELVVVGVALLVVLWLWLLLLLLLFLWLQVVVYTPLRKRTGAKQFMQCAELSPPNETKKRKQLDARTENTKQ